MDVKCNNVCHFMNEEWRAAMMSLKAVEVALYSVSCGGRCRVSVMTTTSLHLTVSHSGYGASSTQMYGGG